jgi:uncharacterized RDD family membrane protein YckC
MWQYAGFWSRLGAGTVDFLVVILLAGLLDFWLSTSREEALVATALLPILGTAYSIYFHGRWGQTIGKMVMRIQVVLLDGSPITWKAAFLRHSVDVLLTFLTTVASILAVLSVAPETLA